MAGTQVATTSRRIGPIGTLARIVVGAALLVLALVDQPSGFIGGLQVYEVALGLLAFPAVMVAVGVVVSRYADGPLRFAGPVGVAANFVVIITLFAVPYTAGAAALFYGVSLLVAAGWSLPNCEATVLSNAILRRDDQIGCPIFTPIDALEASRDGRT